MIYKDNEDIRHIWRKLGGVVQIVCFFCVVGISLNAQDADSENRLTKLNAKNVYVIEVFTSQGCSSCPPADDAVSILHKEAERLGADVHVLGWHVDYWDRLGWKDPYSSSFSTRRQRNYAQRVRRTTVYTPQVLINGNIEVRNPYQTNLIIDALEAVTVPREALNIDVSVDVDSNTAVEVKYTRVDNDGQRRSFLGRGTQYEIGILLTESGLVTTPIRGENRGRRLRNNHVVRAWEFLRLQNDGRISLKIPEDMRRDQGAIVVIAQNLANGKIEYAHTVQL